MLDEIARCGVCILSQNVSYSVQILPFYQLSPFTEYVKLI